MGRIFPEYLDSLVKVYVSSFPASSSLNSGNTYLNAPKTLNSDFSCKSFENLYFAGQMTGVEGYVESTASGFVAGISLARKLLGKDEFAFPIETAIGALGNYVSHADADNFQPMNINFGLLPPLGYRVKGKRFKNAELSKRSLALIKEIEEI